MKHTTTPTFCHRVIRVEASTGRYTIVKRFAASELAQALNLANYHNRIEQYETFVYSVETIPTNTK